MDLFFFINYTGFGWGLAMTGEDNGDFEFNFEVPGTRTIVAPKGTIEDGQSIADAWNRGESVELPEGATLHRGPARERVARA